MDYPVRWLSKTIDFNKPLAILIHGGTQGLRI